VDEYVFILVCLVVIQMTKINVFRVNSVTSPWCPHKIVDLVINRAVKIRGERFRSKLYERVGWW
jgi:hypothetical protein